MTGARGRFLSFEGGEGVGKSTQVRALADALRTHGLDVVETREPGGSEGAELIRRLLLEGGADRFTPRAEALLFAAARADHVARIIRPALDAGRWVLCDRYLDSSLAYQGAADAIGAAAVRDLHGFGSEGLLPDRTLLLTLAGDEAGTRLAARDGGVSDRFGARGGAYHARVADAFLSLARHAPERIRIVDAGGSSAAVTARLLASITDLLP